MKKFIKQDISKELYKIPQKIISIDKKPIKLPEELQKKGGTKGSSILGWEDHNQSMKRVYPYFTTPQNREGQAEKEVVDTSQFNFGRAGTIYSLNDDGGNYQ
jgi:hypothetical protein